MSNRRAIPSIFRAAGLSDAFSVGDSFPGAMVNLQNMIPFPGGQGHWVPRPAANTIVSGNQPPLWGSMFWGAFTWGGGWGAILGPGQVSGLTTLGHYVFGMISSTTGVYAGKDVPFMYDMLGQSFHDFTIMGGAASLPATPPAGDWVPPRFAAFPGRIIVTHPGFSTLPGPVIGWMDFGSFSDTTHTGNTHSNTTIDNLSSNVLQAGWYVGMVITGAGIPPNTTVVALAASGTSITLSQAATATATGVALTVSGGTLANPLWGAGNVNAYPLAKVPTDVFNFNGRAYYAVPGSGMWFSDIGAPLQITNASQAIFPNNGLDVTCFGGLPINQTQTGPITSLFCFQGDANILKVTGDAALQNLSMQSVPNGVGTLAPNTVVSTPMGLAFIAPDGLRYIDFDGNASPIVGSAGQGVNIPFINAVYPSRMNAAYNEDCYRISVLNGARPVPVWEDYWLHVTSKMFSGPHTDASIAVAAYQQQMGAASGHGFVFAMQGFANSLYIGSVIPNAQAGYIENGQTLNCTWQTCYTPDNEMLTENAVVESTLLCAIPTQSTMSVLVANELGLTLDQIQLTGPRPAPQWGTMVWGQFYWGGAPTAPYQHDLPWDQPIVFKQCSLKATVQAGTGLVIGAWRYNNIVLGYRLETFAGYV